MQSSSSILTSANGKSTESANTTPQNFSSDASDTDLAQLLQQNAFLEDGEKPVFFRLAKAEDAAALQDLLTSEKGISVCDRILTQLRDLIKLEHPESVLTDEEYSIKTAEKFAGRPANEYGVWVYYPWRREIVHMLDEAEFIRVRTVRNAYKITFEEQALLRTKKIGIIGLSVGQSASLCAAMERMAGEIRIADFDTLELSNLNRIRTGVYNLGVKKTTIVAREIAEIDPFINVICHHEGFGEENADAFFDEGGTLDLLFEECDSVDIKILARQHARRRGLPVVMDTSDRGMVDIERYDNDPTYPMLHGLIDDTITPEFIRSLKTNEEKLPYVMPILGIESISMRLKASGLEVGKSITTWPQLGGDVALGGALCANVGRRILLGENIKSGRSYVDVNDIIPAEKTSQYKPVDVEDKPFDRTNIPAIYDSLALAANNGPDQESIDRMIADACRATSPGNLQQWLWYYREGNLLLFLDKGSDKGFADNFHFGSIMALGSALENLRLSASTKGLRADIDFHSGAASSNLFAVINFSNISTQNKADLESAAQISKRHCNRANDPYKPLSEGQKEALQSIEIPEGIQLHFIDAKQSVDALGSLVCKGDRIMLTNAYGHGGFFKHEIRWTKEESKEKGDGMDISLFPLTGAAKLGLQLSKDAETVQFLRSIDGGGGFERVSEKSFAGAAAIGIITIPHYDRANLLQAGIALERLWLKATALDIGVQPFTTLQALFTRLYKDDQGYINAGERSRIASLKNQFETLVPGTAGRESVFLFRFANTTTKADFSFRKNNKQNLILS